ncbi:hypothetical protein ISN45_At05g041510 [Arabidopsis thaliana x Arabidopsis arenosa]|uniref:Uncharacterized protein n=2 Tax=Arabidopsis TaxID=3701 RepID=A0A8T2DKJ4_ARASU|nr:hypothetical protein ISN45_At05g041510 [Arabidopsis thaliana x Arabidopsis arenosa]KAG7611947.1 hypothetical protein ISN44_As05g040170 [Arabidopsis suecica]
MFMGGPCLTCEHLSLVEWLVASCRALPLVFISLKS